MQGGEQRVSVEALLGNLYDAVLEPTGFQVFIDAMVPCFQLKAVTMIIRNIKTEEMRGLWLSGIGVEWVNSYALEYGSEDMLAAHIRDAPIAHFYASNLDLQGPATFSDTRFYKEWIVPQGIAYAAGAIILQEGNWLTQLILQRGPNDPEFSRRDIESFNALVPHIQRAIQIRQRMADLEVTRNFLVGGLDVLAMPTFLFDEFGKVAHSNESALFLLKGSKDLSLVNGHLQCNDDPTNRKLGTELANALRASRGEGSVLNNAVLLQRTNQLPLMLMVAPLKLSGGDKRTHGGALLFAFEPEKTPTVTVGLVKQLFELTEAEASLAVALCGGSSLEDVACDRGTSINTIKSQLKSVFIKTGTRRQSELVSLILASPAYLLTSKLSTEMIK